MTTVHVATLYFGGRGEAAKKRLQKIKSAGLIAERKRRVNEPSVLFLTRKAFKVLQDHGSLSQYPALSVTSFEGRAQVSELTLRHELEVMDVKSAFYAAVSKTGQFVMTDFITWPLLCQFQAIRPGQGVEVLVKPDGFIRIQERERDEGLSEHTFFLEVDRSSETQDTLVLRAGCYLEYYRTGGFARRNGAEPSAYKDYPFRVLMVFKTAERRNNTAERLFESNPPILTQVYLSTIQEVTTSPLDAIWVRPWDYRQATKGTPFEPGRQQEVWGYKRQSVREDFIERNVKKCRLLVEWSNDESE